MALGGARAPVWHLVLLDQGYAVGISSRTFNVYPRMPRILTADRGLLAVAGVGRDAQTAKNQPRREFQ